jgi:hypothetical protein
MTTALWVTQRLAEEPQEKRIGIFRVWANPRHHPEITQETIKEINALSNGDAIKALNKLKKPPQYIYSQSGNQMNLDLWLSSLATGEGHRAKALLDSSCSCTCINREFVKKNKIPTKRMARPIPIYNADGTQNLEESITEYVELWMQIQYHTERIHMAVLNLGKSNVFIGHDWLKKNNPWINWRRSLLFFENCPQSCNIIDDGGEIRNLTGDQDQNVPSSSDELRTTLEEGERLFTFDVVAYSM